jgi:hypothetical protein
MWERSRMMAEKNRAWRGIIDGNHKRAAEHSKSRRARMHSSRTGWPKLPVVGGGDGRNCSPCLWGNAGRCVPAVLLETRPCFVCLPTGLLPNSTSAASFYLM